MIIISFTSFLLYTFCFRLFCIYVNPKKSADLYKVFSRCYWCSRKVKNQKLWSDATHCRDESGFTATHLFPVRPFSTPWKHQKALRFSGCFQGVEKGFTGNKWANDFWWPIQIAFKDISKRFYQGKWPIPIAFKDISKRFYQGN